MDSELIEAAREVRRNAYAPYSGYMVGSALRSESGRIFAGCNVENVSYGATICAERNAIGAMAAAGDRKIARLAVATLDGGTPCGICLQAIAEFAASTAEILAVDDSGAVRRFELADLLPHGFSSEAVPKTAGH